MSTFETVINLLFCLRQWVDYKFVRSNFLDPVCLCLKHLHIFISGRMKPLKYTNPSTFILTCTLRKSKLIDVFTKRLHVIIPILFQKICMSSLKKMSKYTKPTPFRPVRAKRRLTWTLRETQETIGKRGNRVWTFYCPL